MPSRVIVDDSFIILFFFLSLSFSKEEKEKEKKRRVMKYGDEGERLTDCRSKQQLAAGPAHI